MSFPFDSQQGLIIIRNELWGPAGSIVLRLALDTGGNWHGGEHRDVGYYRLRPRTENGTC